MLELAYVKCMLKGMKQRLEYSQAFGVVYGKIVRVSICQVNGEGYETNFKNQTGTC